MSESNKHHEYDGIVEHDNPLPTWWLWTFFITIIFGFMYFIHYQFAGGPTLKEELSVAMAQLEKEQAAAQSASPMETEESLAEVFKKDGIVQLGASTFASKCAACHGAELQGLIGPNLTDKFWLHGKGTRMDIVKTIRDGVSDKGMPPWGPVMKKEEVYAVAAFILSKKGSNPPGAKAPQGEEVP
ncbi:cbb3-type cytochrome c oxidase N-terminal domain-containing protein [Bdellovibrio sp. NC01]|uniref:cbb3-type cytochrome c oxidase N-terminal domain-containing protein n=1 Tax=Bdellovibrio sp. NC01 TaxID=2220073 RepID=UPI00115ADD81|nr:cbb3-type cytochrome c oxidase N-terminal domain-containing protein [Bdellovibrio sp. NC01]QDK38400.1 nitrogen fixation protein FixP [Bdellovibrio sp. NC01]